MVFVLRNSYLIFRKAAWHFFAVPKEMPVQLSGGMSTQFLMRILNPMGGIVYGHAAGNCLLPWLYAVRIFFSSASSSAIACSNCSSLGAFPCQPAWFSIKETPLPLVVFIRMAVGFPLPLAS